MQRQNFEIFGSTLCLDLMKHQSNSIMWPNTTVCALNKMKQVISCGEAFCCQEKIEAYIWVMQIFATMAPSEELVNCPSDFR